MVWLTCFDFNFWCLLLELVLLIISLLIIFNLNFLVCLGGAAPSLVSGSLSLEKTMRNKNGKNENSDNKLVKKSNSNSSKETPSSPAIMSKPPPPRKEHKSKEPRRSHSKSSRELKDLTLKN